MAHGDTRIIPVELQESLLPLLIEEFALRDDSGGAGKFRGGLGFRKTYRVIEPCMLQTNLDRTKFPAWGIQGGKDALPGRFTVIDGETGESKPVGKETGYRLKPGDRVIVETGGGGGYGAPAQRSLDMIQRDVNAAYISPDAAGRDYGVTVDKNGKVRR